MEAVKLVASRAMSKAGISVPFDQSTPLQITYEATYPYPTSWARKKIASTTWKTSKPDIDNLFKLVADAMKDIVFSDDAIVGRAVASKRYGAAPAARITVSTLH